MARRKKRGMGRLLVEMTTKPLILFLAGGLGLFFMLGGFVGVVWMLFLPVLDSDSGGHGIKGALISLFAVLSLGGLALLIASILERSSGIRIYEEGVVYRRFWGKHRLIPWVEVKDFYLQHKGGYELGDAGYVDDYYWWTLALQDGTQVNFRNTFYHSGEFADTMETLSEEFQRYRQDFNLKYGPV